MRLTLSVAFLAGWLALGCGSAATTVAGAACPAGRTQLDGVCVREQIADYVACVRAQGAQLDATSRTNLSAAAGTLAMHASAASDVSDQLQKKYSVSEGATLQIIDACNRASGLAVSPPPPTPAGAPALDAEGYALDWAINCRPEGCVASGPGCDTTAVRGQCSFPRERAVELCSHHPSCVALNCNTTRSDCQARDTVKRDAWKGMKSIVVKR